MNYDSRFKEYLTNIARGDADLRLSRVMEASAYCVQNQRYDDAALVIILASRCLSAPNSRERLLAALSERELLERLVRIRIFAAWLSETDVDHERGPRISHDDLEAGWIESDAYSSNDELLSACRELFGTLAPNEDNAGALGGLNLIFRLNRSRNRGEVNRIYNPASFGLRHIDSSAEEERHTILGRVSLGELSIRSVRLGTEPPVAGED